MYSTFFKRFVIAGIILFSGVRLQAQLYTYEIGGILGGCYYTGELNRKPLNNLQPVIGMLFRYNHTSRWSLKATANGAKCKGYSKSIRNQYPEYDYQSFKRTFVDLGGQVEFNFSPYGDSFPYLTIHHFSPYLTLGTGYTISSGFKGFSVIAGIGFKYKIMHRIHVNGELSVRQLFSDAFDVTDQSNSMLDDPYKMNSHNWKNKDRYSFFLVSITWDFLLKDPFCK